MRSKAIISALIAAISLAASFVSAAGEQDAPPTPAAYNIAVILAEPGDIPHETGSITAQPCKLIPEKTYPNGHGKEYYQDLVHCVADYHKENSFGTVNLDFEIFDNNGQWFKTDRKEADYVGKEKEFVIDAINLAKNTGIDFSGRDMIIVLHAGTSYQKAYIPVVNEKPEKLWTETWSPASQPSRGISSYKLIIAEKDSIGFWAHEIGHLIGAFFTPQETIISDLQYSGLESKWLLPDPVKAGDWDLMAGGGWNEGEKNPPYMSSYTKEFLRWLNYDIHPKSAYGEHWINSLETSKLGNKVFRYNLSEDANDESQRYYILEARNRNLKTWDSSLPVDKALVLYQVDTKGYDEYGYASDGYSNSHHKIITIPSPAHDLSIGFNDGVLEKGDIYRDYDNLVQFIFKEDKIISDNYEIKTKVERINKDSFSGKFFGVVLKPSAIFKNKINLSLNIFNPLSNKAYDLKMPLKGPTTISEVLLEISRSIFWLLLIPLVLLWIIILLVGKAVIWFKLEKIKKSLKIALKVIWLLILTNLIIIFIFLIGSYITKDKKQSCSPGLDCDLEPAIRNSLLFADFSPDLDLHLYCDDGNHIGMNYQTGEYEVQIPEAIASGDEPNAPEWIYIPATITNCHYAVSSHDNQRFLADNPEIAGQMEDKSDSYDIYARYIDPETGIYTSSMISETINAGVEREHAIGGTTDVGIQSGAVTLDTLRHEILNARNLGLIDNQGIADSLLQKLDAAQKKLDQNETRAAKNQLTALRNEIKAQQGKHIATDTAAVLIGDADALIDSLAVQPDADLSILLSRIQAAVARLKSLLPGLAGYLR